LWIEVGDHNTKFFQIFTNHKKNFNSIWELKDSHGNKKKGFSKLAYLGVNHFKGLFSESKKGKVGEMLKLISLIPRLVKEVDTRD
jgi:hypothetical protein